jgi:hypothetical protein
MEFRAQARAGDLNGQFQGRKSAMGRLTLSYVWKQKQTPVVLRRTGRGARLRVRLPFADDNRQWLRNGRRTAPEWIGGTSAYWELPKSWFNDFVDRALLLGRDLPQCRRGRQAQQCAQLGVEGAPS